MLPEGWSAFQLGELMTFRNGLNYTQSDTGEEIKVVGVADFQSRSSIEDTSLLQHIQVSGQVAEADLLKSGDLLFVRSNGNKALIGRCLYFPKIDERLSFSGFTIRGRADASKLDAQFAAYLMKLPQVAVQMHLGGTGTNISNLSQEILSGIRLAVPTISEQRGIAEVLNVWDAAIATTEKILANSRRQQEALTNDLLLGRVRRAGFATSSKQVATRVGRMPQDWKHIPISEVATEISIKNVANEALPVLSCTKHHGLVDSLSYFSKRVFSENTSTYKIVPRGAFAYATNHIDEGSIGYQDLYDRALISPMYTVFKVTEQVNHLFLFKLLKTEHFRQVFAVNTNASVDRRGSLRWCEFKKIEIPVPSLAEQSAVIDILDVAKQELEQLTSQLESLKAEKRALMADLLTGNRRVCLPEPTTEAQKAA